MSAEPVTGGEESLLAFISVAFALAVAEEVVVAQSPLRNRDRVVLQANRAVVVEQRNSQRIILTGIIRFLGEQHVVLPEPMNACARVGSRCVVPEGELALSRKQISTEDASIVL